MPVNHDMLTTIRLQQVSASLLFKKLLPLHLIYIQNVFLKACVIRISIAPWFVPYLDDDIIINENSKEEEATRRTFNEANEKLMIIVLFINNRQPCIA